MLYHFSYIIENAGRYHHILRGRLSQKIYSRERYWEYNERKKIERKIIFIISIKQKQSKVVMHIIQDEIFENMILTGKIKGKRKRSKQHIAYK